MRFLVLSITFLFLLFFSVRGEWIKIFNAGNQGDTPCCILQTFDGGYILLGLSGEYPFILKLDRQGNIRWQKKLYSSSNLWVGAVIQTSDGGYIVAGEVNKVIGDHIFVMKLNGLGQFQWQKSYNRGGYDWAMDVKQTFDGGYVIVGRSDSDILIMKLDSFGRIQWDRTLGGVSEEKIATAVQQTSDGGYLIVGKIFYINSDIESFVVKLNSLGHIQWQKLFRIGDYMSIYSVQEIPGEGYIVSGVADDKFFIIKLSLDGNPVWKRLFEGSNSVSVNEFWAKRALDGGYIGVGTLDENAVENAFWLKLNSWGILQWSKTFNSGSCDKGKDISVTSDGGYVITGSVNCAFSEVDVFVAKVNSEGEIPGCAEIEDVSFRLKSSNLSVREGNFQERAGNLVLTNEIIGLSNISFSYLTVCEDTGIVCAARSVPIRRVVNYYRKNESPDFIKVENGELSLCLNYTRNAVAFVLVFNSDFSNYWWLTSRCNFADKNHFSVFMEGETGKTCTNVSLPVSDGYIAWLVFGQNSVGAINWSVDPYELGIKEF